MSRIVLADFEGDLKTLKRSTKLMRNRDFSNLVHVIEKFHRDVKLSSLTIKERTQLIHLGEDAQFYRILVRMLHEVTLTSGIKQREDLKKVVQWYQTNKEVLHGHPHFKGATKDLYKKPSLSFSKDAIKHYSLPRDKRNKKTVRISTEQRSKSASALRSKPKVPNREEGAGDGKDGGGVHGARPLTAPPAPGLHRPKITNSLSSSNNNHAPIIEENSFMVNYVNSKLAKYDNYAPSLSRPTSAIGMATATHEISENNSSKADTESQIQTPCASMESISAIQQPQDPAPHPAVSQENLSIPDSEHTFDTKEGVIEYDERGLPKVVYPLPSLISPFGQEDIIEEESYHGGQPSDKRSKSPLKLHVKVNVPGKSIALGQFQIAIVKPWVKPDSEHTFDTKDGVIEYDERGLPKVIYPLPSLISPFGQEDIIEEESYHGGQPSDKRSKSPLKLHVKVNVPGKSIALGQFQIAIVKPWVKPDSEHTFDTKDGVIEYDERGLPKVVYPLSSLISPFGQEDIIEEESYHGGQPSDKRSKSPLKLHVKVNVPGKSIALGQFQIAIVKPWVKPDSEHTFDTKDGVIEYDERGLPKVVYPLPSLISPFGQEDIIEEESYHGGQPSDKRSKSPLKLHVKVNVPAIVKPWVKPDSEHTFDTKDGVIEYDERGLPKVVYPLPSLISPFGQEDIIEEESYHGGQPSDKRSKSPLKLHVKVNVPVDIVKPWVKPDSEHTFDTKDGVIEYDERGLPKVVYPLPSLISPFGQEDIIEEESYHGGQPSDKTSKSPLKLHVKVNVPVAENDDISNMTEEEQKANNLQKWQYFQERQAFEQELASKQAFFGRGGDPMGVRYNVHDGGEMPEWYTHDVIANYAEEEGLLHQQVKTGEAFQSQELQDFYLSTDKYSPPVRPSSRTSPREGITPVSSAIDKVMEENIDARGFIPDEATENLQDRPPTKHEREKYSKHSVHFESVVDLAGPVSDAMTMYKEVISPEPQLGFRQPALEITAKPPPAVNSQPTEDLESPPQSPNSQSIYKMEYEGEAVVPPNSIYKMAHDGEGLAVVPPNSSRFSGSSKSMTSDYTQRNKRGEPIILLPEESEYTVHFRRRPRPVTATPVIPHAISSRQATRTQSSPKYKWGIELPDEDHLHKLSRTKSAPSRRSLRSAGSTSGGRRPRTAIDTSMKQRWNLQNDNDNNHRVPQAASHSSTTMATNAVASLMVVSHLGGDNRRARSRMGYRGLKGYDENLPGFLPDMQFLSITGPAPLQARGQGDSIAEETEDVPSSNDSKTPSENASTHPQLDNLPTQQWAGLSMSSENPDQLSDPFSMREGQTLAGGTASDRSSLLSVIESDRMKDLEDMDSEQGTSHQDGDENDTPRTIDADLSIDLEAAGDNDTPQSTHPADGEATNKEDNTIRTIDIDMRSVSQINTEHDDDQSAIESQMSDKRSIDGHDQSAIESQMLDNGLNKILDDQCEEETMDATEDEKDATGKTGLLGMIVASKNTQETIDAEQKQDTAQTLGDEKAHNVESSIKQHQDTEQTFGDEEAHSVESSVEQHKDTEQILGDDEAHSVESSVTLQNVPTVQNLDNEEATSMDGSVISNYEEFVTEKDILTGAEKADFLSKSFLAVTRNRRVERPSSAQSRLCPTHKLMMEEEGRRSNSPVGIGREKGLKSASTESVRSLPIGLTYMPLTDEHRTRLERTVPLMDTPGFPMMPSVSKKALSPRSTPNASARSTPVSSIYGSPSESRESFGGSPKGSTAQSDGKNSHHFRPITPDNLDDRERSPSTLPPPPNILIRRPTSAPSNRSPRIDYDKEISEQVVHRPTSAKNQSSTSPRSCSPKSPHGRSPKTDGDVNDENISSLSPQPPNRSSRPASARRPRSASPRSPTSPRPTSAKELRVASPVPQRPSSPGRTGPEWKGRPLNVYGVKDRSVEEEEYKRQQEAKNKVSIQNLFSKSSSKGYRKDMNRQGKERLEKKRKEDLERQRNYNEHIWKRDMALIKHKGPMDKSWERDYMIDKLMRERMRQEKWTAMKQQQEMENRKAQSYLKRIGPSVDIWDMFHGEKRGVTRGQFRKAAILLQRYIRGWIVRSMLKKVIKKSRVHAGSFKTFVKYYNTVLKRIARWHGIKKPRIHANLWEMDQFMDKKRYYESVFVNRTHPGDEMLVKEIDLFFKECDHYPSKREVYNAILGATKKDPDKPHLKLKEKDVVETAFMIYVPPGTGLKIDNLRSSTWLNPLVKGEEARKLMGSEHVEQTSYLTSIQVVAAALNEHKERELEEIKRQARKAEEAAKNKEAENS
ncbi:LOW QUALITY PROTEIN: uncharacterized protein [Amphiura filiformis]|uniref:LOW QUALITY PROTEIN: uncharacterized protein n=1 Tax=Amphiura filiformis TaxID=82378 RepID=UPI003B217D31